MRFVIFVSISVFAAAFIWGITGVWLAVLITELITMIVALVFINQNMVKYHYAKKAYFHAVQRLIKKRFVVAKSLSGFYFMNGFGYGEPLKICLVERDILPMSMNTLTI